MGHPNATETQPVKEVREEHMRPPLCDRPVFQGVLIAIIATISIVGGIDPASPPRFDGAGYSVLALSLLSGQGYREIDRPDSPRHAHFPPGYPATLALIWSVTGKSAPAAHIASAACTIAAVLLASRWMRKVATSRVALLCGLSVAVNWTWARNGGSIQSEPLFLVLSQLAILATLGFVGKGDRLRAERPEGPDPSKTRPVPVPLFRQGRRSTKPLAAAGLGMLLALCVLTRHVGLALAGAIWLHLLLTRRTRAAMIALITAGCLVLPWVAWLASVRENTQVGLLAEGSLASRIATLSLFYLQRIPDQITGPFVEVATVFRRGRGLALALNLWAGLATSVIVAGWLVFLRRPRKRLAGLIPIATLALLLVWPFTEAGRFLIPLVPFLILGATEGLAFLARRLGGCPAETGRRWGAAAVLAASIPYSLYGLIADRSKAQRQTHAAFDLACAWIKTEGLRPGPVVCRHPGELFWLTGRKGLPIESNRDISEILVKEGISYLLIDEERYANAPTNPLTEFVKGNPGRVRELWSRDVAGGPSMTIYEVVDSHLAGASKRILP